MATDGNDQPISARPTPTGSGAGNVPIQGEGGDRHFRPQFFAAIRSLCDEFDALLIFDEVQTGCGITGTAWAYQQLGVEPDVVAFGKKTQVCGIMAGRRVDEVVDNVFAVSSRINSTWGGNLADMVRARRILEVIEADELFARAAERGRYLRARLDELARDFPAVVLDPRGRGLMCAFSLPTTADRDEVIRALWQRAVRERLPRVRDVSRAGRPEHSGLQSLRRHALLLECVSLQSPLLQLARLRSSRTAPVRVP